MNFDQVVQHVALAFIFWEVVKIFFIPKVIWKNVLVSLKISDFKKKHAGEKTKLSLATEKNNRSFLMQRNPVLQFIGYIYLLFVLLTFFTPWWWIGLLMIGLSTASMYAIKPMLGRREKFSLNVWLILFLDGVFTILLLSIMYNPLTLIK